MGRMVGPGEAEQSQYPSPGFPEEFARDELEVAFFDRLAAPAVDEVRLPARPESAAEARRLTLSVLELWGLVQQREAAEQLVGELVANAVKHTGGRTVGLRFVRRPGWLRVEVRDPSRALPCLIRVEPAADSGRGLHLVETLSDRWGADLLSRGKSVWFELRVRER
ncbi:ATP-binding protein [Peterkaempfera bronchialis]|uniref:ATP-binding protein n=2 Tax=Peterkaempfera bronchialis TaxID=2126346 RepID=A0A345T6F7_9ACTN|nr:ATP-binding protein [Peterkaempfera bronchialis]